MLGRTKKRDSVLIRKLLAAGLSFRKISVIAKCSAGSVNAEKIAMKKEELQKKIEQEIKQKQSEIAPELVSKNQVSPDLNESKVNFPEVA